MNSLILITGIEQRVNDMYVIATPNTQNGGCVFKYRSVMVGDLIDNWYTSYVNKGNETRAIRDITNIQFDKIIIV